MIPALLLLLATQDISGAGLAVGGDLAVGSTLNAPTPSAYPQHVAETTFPTTDNPITISAPGGVLHWGQFIGKDVGDIDHDGFDDFVVCNADFSTDPGSVEIIYGGATPGSHRQVLNPPGSFACSSGTCTPRDWGFRANIVPSLNGDAFADLLVVGYDQEHNSQEYVFFFAGGVSGVATSPSSILESPTYTNLGYRVAVDDFNGDGKLDLVLESSVENADYLLPLNNAFPSSGLVTARASTLITATSKSRSPRSIGRVGTNAGASFALIGGDGSNSFLAVVGGRTSWPATLNVASDTSTSLRTYASNQHASDLTVDDVNADGYFDLSICSGDNTRDIVLLSNAGVYPASTPSFTVAGVGGSTVAAASLCGGFVGDMNGDGRPDFAVAGSPSTPFYLTPSPPVSLSTPDRTLTTGANASVISGYLYGRPAHSALIIFDPSVPQIVIHHI